MPIQSSIVGVVANWYMGDVSSVAAGLPTVLLEAGYSREHEREADRGKGKSLGYLSSHPAKEEKIEVLRGDRDG